MRETSLAPKNIYIKYRYTMMIKYDCQIIIAIGFHYHCFCQNYYSYFVVIYNVFVIISNALIVVVTF